MSRDSSSIIKPMAQKLCDRLGIDKKEDASAYYITWEAVMDAFFEGMEYGRKMRERLEKEHRENAQSTS